MRVLECNFTAEYEASIFYLDWMYKVQVLDPKGLEELISE